MPATSPPATPPGIPSTPLASELCGAEALAPSLSVLWFGTTLDLWPMTLGGGSSGRPPMRMLLLPKPRPSPTSTRRRGARVAWAPCPGGPTMRGCCRFASERVVSLARSSLWGRIGIISGWRLILDLRTPCIGRRGSASWPPRRPWPALFFGAAKLCPPSMRLRAGLWARASQGLLTDGDFLFEFEEVAGHLCLAREARTSDCVFSRAYGDDL